MGNILKLSDRMKQYENVTQTRLIRRQPVIIRIDGRAFHTYTHKLDKPFDIDLAEAFEYTCSKLKDEIQGAKFIYTQSDEISILLTDWEELNTDSWFDYRIQKITSISAALTTCYFNEYVDKIVSDYFKLYNRKDIDYKEEQDCLQKYNLWKTKKNKAIFDARTFNLPNEEVCNYFISRQIDAIRNSKSSLGRAYFSPKELNKKNSDEVVKMVQDKAGINWKELSSRQQQGICLYKDLDKNKWIIDLNIPDFKVDRNYINKYVLSKGE